MNKRTVLVAIVVAVMLASVSACGGGGGSGETDGPRVPTPPTEPEEPTPPATLEIDPGMLQAGCDPLHTDCLLPFPSDFYTEADAAMPNGHRVAFVRDALPANLSGVHVDPGPWARNDGFSPGAALVLRYPGVDLEYRY